VKTTLEPLEGNKVKLSVEVEEAEFDRDIDAAFKKIAREVNLPGFRAGKAPRRLLEARIGLAPAREQALNDAIPKYLAKAVRENDVDLIATPDIEITGGEETGPVVFDATCEVRPEITVPGYGGLRVELPPVVASDEEIDEVVQNELRRAGTLTSVERPVVTGDQVTLDLSATRDGEEVIGLNTEDWLYEVGKGWVADVFDEQLIGSSPGELLEFNATPNGTNEAADFKVAVKQVQEVVLPELTDEWVEENLGEFDTIDEWKANIAERLGDAKLNQARGLLVERTTGALVELTEIEPPESMIDNELRARVNNTVGRFQQQGISMEQVLAATGQSAEEFIDVLRGQSVQAIKADLALRAVAAAEALEAEDDDIEQEYQRIAVQVNQKVNQVRKAYEKNDAVDDLKSQLRKSKALDWLLEHVEIVDTNGTPIDSAVLLGQDHYVHGDHVHFGDDGHGHDHGHDHAEGHHDHDHDADDHDHNHDEDDS
jgi:trigger factor